MRRVVSLDPDYVPWEHKVVRLRKKKAPAIVLLLVVVALGFGVYQKESAKRRNSAPHRDVMVVEATPTVAPTATPLVIKTPCEPTGRPGSLTLAYNEGCSVMRMACDTYQAAGKSGTTEAGPVVVIEGDEARFVCDGTEMEFVVPEGGAQE
jgi:hypothetical protein